MNNNLMKTINGAALTILMLSVFTPIWVSAQDNGIEVQKLEELSNERKRQNIEGVWRTVVTPRICQTGDPIPNIPPIRGLFTFNQGGTMSEWGVGPGQTPALRSPGHGLWGQTRGIRDYSFTFIHLRYDASGAFLGAQKISAILRLGASGNSFTTNSAIEILDPNDNVISVGCATAVGTRFE